MDKCETCVWYVYDEEYDDYLCDMDLDEDELARFLASDTRSCPYWRPLAGGFVFRRLEGAGVQMITHGCTYRSAPVHQRR